MRLPSDSNTDCCDRRDRRSNRHIALKARRASTRCGLLTPWLHEGAKLWAHEALHHLGELVRCGLLHPAWDALCLPGSGFFNRRGDVPWQSTQGRGQARLPLLRRRHGWRQDTLGAGEVPPMRFRRLAIRSSSIGRIMFSNMLPFSPEYLPLLRTVHGTALRDLCRF